VSCTTNGTIGCRLSCPTKLRITRTRISQKYSISRKPISSANPTTRVAETPSVRPARATSNHIFAHSSSHTSKVPARSRLRQGRNSLRIGISTGLVKR
jgi:hypothetical protein